MNGSEKIISAALLIIMLAFAAAVFADGDPEDYEFKTYTYKTVGSRNIDIHVHFPHDWKKTDKRPAIIFYFGGGWNSGTVNQFLAQADYFASRGLVTARADYRVKSRDGVTPDICTEDARSAIRWLKQNHKKLGIDPEKVIASGGSAGGHLAGTTMIPKSVEDAGDDLSISTVPAAMLLFNPVLNFNIKNDTRSIKERMGERGHLAEKISPTLHLSKNTPPAIVFFGTDDELKIHGDEYCKIAKKLGVRAEQFTAKGQGHGFFNKSPWLEKTMLAADKFLISLGLTQGKPTVKVPKDESRAQDQEAAKEKVDTQKTSLADQLEKRWQTMDANKDDKLSTDEAKGPFKNNFDKIDTNSDGFIDRSELAKVADRMTRK